MLLCWFKVYCWHSSTFTEHSTTSSFILLHSYLNKDPYHTCTGHRNIFTTILLLSDCCFTSTGFNLSSLMAKTGTIIISGGGSLLDTIMGPSLYYNIHSSVKEHFISEVCLSTTYDQYYKKWEHQIRIFTYIKCLRFQNPTQIYLGSFFFLQSRPRPRLRSLKYNNYSHQ